LRVDCNRSCEHERNSGKVKPLSNQQDNSGDRASSKLSPSKESTSKPVERTRAAVAREVNLPERKLRSAQELKAKAPELVAKVRAGEMTMAQAKKEVRKEETRKTKGPDSIGRVYLLRATRFPWPFFFALGELNRGSEKQSPARLG
jgi:hypothetical protein